MIYSERTKRLYFKHVFAKSFDVLVDPAPKNGSEPVLAIQVEPVDATPFVLPMAYSIAYEMASMIFDTLSAVAPEMFVPEEADQ